MKTRSSLERRAFISFLAASGITAPLFGRSLWESVSQDKEITAASVRHAANLAGLAFSEEEEEHIVRGVSRYRAGFNKLRQMAVGEHTPPAFVFRPGGDGAAARPSGRPPALPEAETTQEPLHFKGIRELGARLRGKSLTSVALTRACLDRLKKLDPKLLCVITLTEELAMKQAARADRELAAGKDRGPLHGIPWGAKDLLDTAGIRTTWGAAPFKDRVATVDAAVVTSLEKAGAVLVAKLTLGALAMGDQWFGGRTRNPWNTKRGSSGSSAGSASAVVAGCVPFAIGSETLGSIVSPCTRCGATGLRPTFGRVSRYGAMPLSWTMDKIGPIARTAEDCALVFDAIHGADPRDPATVDRPFLWDPSVAPKDLRIGYVHADMFRGTQRRDRDFAVVEKLRALGAKPEAVKLPATDVVPLLTILDAEAATAFDDITRDGRVRKLVNQSAGAWPNQFRRARFIPAVEYLRAMRVRTRLIEETERVFAGYDAIVARSFGSTLALTNLTGHPAVVMPNGFRRPGSPVSIVFVGGLHGESHLLAAASAWQRATDHHLKRPPV